MKPTQSDDVPWSTEQLRLTVFPEGKRPVPLVREWWSATTGTPPDHVAEEPAAGAVQLQGKWGGSPLIMRADEIRLDISLLFASGPPTPTHPLNDVLPQFNELAERWLNLEDRPPIQRLAFGTVVLKQYHRIEDCRRAMDNYLPSIDMRNINPPTDFLYQINRRRRSETILDLEVNRLMKWSVQQIQGIAITPTGRVTVAPQTFACRVEIDINSIAEHEGTLMRDRVKPLFKEFVGLADEITKKGDHP